jgi:hypothetical protein
MGGQEERHRGRHYEELLGQVTDCLRQRAPRGVGDLFLGRKPQYPVTGSPNQIVGLDPIGQHRRRRHDNYEQLGSVETQAISQAAAVILGKGVPEHLVESYEPGR